MPRKRSHAAVVADLTEPQREAVTHGEGPLLVVAGAGSGKTRVITCRIAWLLAQGVAPERVLAITFTNKAADEMRRRVGRLVGGSVQVSTFHSFCAGLLRREVGRIGIDARFSIYDRSDSRRLLRRIVRDMKVDDTSFTPAALLEYVSLCKERVMGPEDAAQKAYGILGRRQAEVYAIYQRRLAESNALDFDDLLLRTIEVFNSAPRVLQFYQDRYLYVLVDEYQDTNLPQHLIARGLQGKHRNITAVGDPDQTIYTWRGARLENLMEFEQDFPGAHVVTLERNYRSSANILRASGAVISHNRLRREKTLWTDRPAGEPVVVMRFDDSYDEARWLAGRVEELVDDGVEPTEIAVFYRTKQQSVPLERAFVELALPYQVVDATRLLDRRGVRDLRAYLQLLVNPRDDVAFMQAINSPRRGIGARTLEKLQVAAGRGRRCLMDVVSEPDLTAGLGARAGKAVSGFWELYRELDAFPTGSVEELVRELADRLQYVERQPVEERADMAETLQLWFTDVADYDRRSPDGGLTGYLEQVALVSDVDGWKGGNAAVPLMTLHSAKGLEFDVVFIVGVEDGIIPHRRAIEEPVHGTEAEALEEERRLFYVGMTRARKRLFISHADYHAGASGGYRVSPSPFLAELPEQGTERASQDSEGRDSGKEAEYVLRRGRTSLTIEDGPDEALLASGVRVSHPQFGQGEVTEVKPMAGRLMVRVSFIESGPMTLLLPLEEAIKNS
jgi:DNA helicase-2/ATP-dependent DNA helicase PcrA